MPFIPQFIHRAALAGTRAVALRVLACSVGMAWTVGLHAQTGLEGVTDNLPYLPGSDAAGPVYFDIAEESASIGYESRLKKWSATIEQYSDVNPAVTMDYGLQVTNKLGVGGTFTRQSDYSEVVLNGIYAPRRNLRFRVTGAQLRTAGSYFDGDASSIFLQNSYLFGAKKYWTKYEHLSDIGLTAYSIGTNAPPAAHVPVSTTDHAFAPGRMDGYLLNLNLHPTPVSKLELRHEASRLTYFFYAGARRSEQVASNRIKYSRYFGDCMRIQGGYSAGEEMDRMDLKLAKNNWNIRLSLEEESGVRDTGIHFGYAIPLGRAAHQPRDCGIGTQTPATFEPLIDAAATRPPQLPREPLAIAD